MVEVNTDKERAGVGILSKGFSMITMTIDRIEIVESFLKFHFGGSR
jgi:hypothetical protein